MDKKKKALTREQAMELYDDLEKAMGHLLPPKERQARPSGKQRAQAAYQQPKAAARVPSDNDLEMLQSMIGRERSSISGKSGAIVFLSILGALKIATACIDASGVFDVSAAQAALAPAAQSVSLSVPAPKFSQEEKKLLTALDDRRAQLEERNRKLDQREHELHVRDQDFASRLTELREMTNSLKLDREKNEKKRSTQIEQLANVYGSMDPKEAASLIEQLDVTISLALLQKMPEKRIAQILALMTPSRALAITKMLSGNDVSSKTP
jgi:flagellar motility protein MotE (MotC chaperone)